MKKILLTTASVILMANASFASAHSLNVNHNAPMVNPHAESNLKVMGHPLQLEGGQPKHTNPKEVNPLFKYVGYDQNQTVPSSTQTPSKHQP